MLAEYGGSGEEYPIGFSPQPSTNTSSTTSFNSGSPGFDWGSNISSWMKLAPNIISSAKGNPYASGQYGQGSFPTVAGGQGQGVYAGGSFLGASGFGNISGTTLILIGLAAFVLLRRK